MNWSEFLSQALAITSTFNFKIALILFFLCAIGEIGFALPYILETIWLLAGYHLATHQMNGLDLLNIWLVAQAGRQVGSTTLYFSGRLGLRPLKRFYARFIEPHMPKRKLIPTSIANQLANPSSFTVAMGRLLGLRLPLAIAMSAQHKLFKLALGVLLSSIIWDGIYIILGATVGSTVVPNPVNMLVYSLGGLTALYLITLGVRYLIRLRRPQRKNPIQ